MGRKLYIGNLSYDTGDDELKLAFAQCGSVAEVKIIIDRETGRSRGFGFVTMSTDQEAQAAVARWSGQALDGRNLTVNEAVDRPRGQASPGQGGSRQNMGGYSGGTYVGDAPPQQDRGRGAPRGRGNDRGRGRDRDYG